MIPGYAWPHAFAPGSINLRLHRHPQILKNIILYLKNSSVQLTSLFTTAHCSLNLEGGPARAPLPVHAAALKTNERIFGNEKSKLQGELLEQAQVSFFVNCDAPQRMKPCLQEATPMVTVYYEFPYELVNFRIKYTGESNNLLG